MKNPNGRRRQYQRKRAEPKSLWVNKPLQNMIREGIERREWTISDLGRAIGSQPSLVSRWMQGQRPNTESIALIANALGLDVKRMLYLAGHLPEYDEEIEDERTLALVTKLRQITMTDERFVAINGILEAMRKADAKAATALSRPVAEAREGDIRASA